MERIKPVRIVKRGRNYQLDFYNLNGERRRISAGSNHFIAQKMAVKFTDWLYEGKNPESEQQKIVKKKKQSALTVRLLYPVFIERHGIFKSKAMLESYECSFKNVCRCPLVADIEIVSITSGLVHDYMHARMKNDNVKAATVNREAAFLKILFAKAVEWELIENNPLKSLKLLPEAEKREVNLTEEQAAVLLKELPDSIADIVEFAIYTGFRRENILSLKIETIRINEKNTTGEVDLVIKGSRKELFPLCLPAVQLLKRIIANRKTGYVFLNPKTKTRYITIHKSFDQAVRKLKLTVNSTKLRFQDLRHVFATWLYQKGASLDDIRPLMGHKDRSTTDRYTTINVKEAGKVLQFMPNIRKKALAEKEPKPSNIVVAQIDTNRIQTS